jgi:putative redox protein
MVEIKLDYTGGFHCRMVHGPSGSVLETDAPKDNMGRGELFSPTDLLAAGLASCIVTTIDIVAQRDGISIKGAHATVEKHMTSDPPRRIAALPVRVTLPKSVPEAARQKLEMVGRHCPVQRSLNPDVQVTLTFEYV